MAALGPLLPCAASCVAAWSQPDTDIGVLVEGSTGSVDPAGLSSKAGKRYSFLEEFGTTKQPQIGTPAAPELSSTKHRVAVFYKYLMNPQALEQAIRSYGSDEKFYEVLSPLYKNKAIAQLINGLPNYKHAIKARLSTVVENDEGTLASDVELSDLGLEERRHRQETAVQPGKTGALVIIFKKLLAWIHGQDIIDQAMEAGRESRRILDRLRDQGVTDDDLSPAQIQALVEMRLTKEAPFPGAAFNPYSSNWPDLGAPDAESYSVKEALASLLKNVNPKQLPGAPGAVAAP